MVVQLTISRSNLKVKAKGQSSWSQEETVSFSAMDTVDWLKSESWINQLRRIAEKMQAVTTLCDFSVVRGGLHCTECYCFSWLFVELFVGATSSKGFI